MSSAMTIFNWLEQITYDKKDWKSFTEDQQASFNPYMIHRFLSMYEGYIDITNVVQKFPYTEKKAIYNTYKSMIPKKKMFLKYIKSTRKKTPDVLLNHISQHFSIPLGEAEDYAYILRKEGVHDILERRGVNEKEIKKLLKELVI
jgi:hypothetical protein